MSLTIITYTHSSGWEIAVLEEGQYRETPKQFKFDKKLVPFLWQDHVDKDLEDVVGLRQGYVFSTTLTADKLKRRYVDKRIYEYQSRVELDTSSLNHWVQIERLLED